MNPANATGRPRVDYTERVLAAIAAGSHTQTQMVIAHGLPRVSVQRALYALQAQGRVERHPVPIEGGGQTIEWHTVLRTVPPSQARVRPCMCCQRPFRSEGFHHRLCNVCRHASHSPYAIAT